MQEVSDVDRKIIVVRKKLVGSAANALPDIDPRVMSEGFTLNRSQQLALITPITREEVHLAMKGINSTSLKEKNHGYQRHR
ncbi:hypothetical protein RDI58_014522 [Solanum bulbocastanum]|uniref:Uncharacterized protein n=1 Tax=Solanum bulbocastanum TaxID=147425 RepID=A0AAN8YB41_SOLBU